MIMVTDDRNATINITKVLGMALTKNNDESVSWEFKGMTNNGDEVSISMGDMKVSEDNELFCHMENLQVGETIKFELKDEN